MFWATLYLNHVTKSSGFFFFFKKKFNYKKFKFLINKILT
jgi:hypothetical protein